MKKGKAQNEKKSSPDIRKYKPRLFKKKPTRPQN